MCAPVPGHAQLPRRSAGAKRYSRGRNVPVRTLAISGGSALPFIGGECGSESWLVYLTRTMCRSIDCASRKTVHVRSSQQPAPKELLPATTPEVRMKCTMCTLHHAGTSSFTYLRKMRSAHSGRWLWAWRGAPHVISVLRPTAMQGVPATIRFRLSVAACPAWRCALGIDRSDLRP